jgi:Tfp pilus assembly protein PilX
MYTYTFGGKKGKKHILYESSDMVVVRTEKSKELKKAIISGGRRKALKDFTLEMEFPEADIAVYKAKPSVKNRLLIRERARSALKKEPGLRFAGRVLVEEDGRTIVLYTENIFIKFFDNTKPGVCEKIIMKNNLSIKQKPGYAKNAYFVSTPENTGPDVFRIAESLLRMKEVELCHPELIRKKELKVIHPLQWHLKPATVNGVKVDANANVENAHKLSLGKNIIIALIDDGFDIDHPEFSQRGKVVHSKDVSSGSSDPRPRYRHENHGTACAGVATASGVLASGVAPKAALMPVRLSSNLGSMAEGNAFRWAADNGADIISCSWGPADGDWTNPKDPSHKIYTDLPDSTRLAMDYAVFAGRKGKGCIITFAAGNGNEDIKYDGYASYEKVIAVAACNDTGKRSVYSDYGKSVWCSFPSSDIGYAPFKHPEPLTDGIYTTDRVGEEGYNPFDDYTYDFGGTSSACPGVAGTVALMLSVNPDLSWTQVREIIKDTSEKIDRINGKYNAPGHSRLYGYGRVDAEKAVRRAIEFKISLPAKKVRNNRSAGLQRESASVKIRRSKKIII